MSTTSATLDLTTPSLTSTPPSTDLDAVIAGLPWRNGVQFGTGINAVTGALGAIAIEPPAVKEATLKSSDTRFRFIRTQNEMEQEIEVSAQGQYNIHATTISGSASYLSQIHYSALGFTLVAIYESRFADFDVAEAYALTPKAKAEIGDREHFRSLYGDYFVAGRRRGSRFVAVYKCRATSRSNVDKFTATFGGSAPDVFTADGSVRFQRAASESQVSIDVSITMEGFEGQQPKPPITPAEVLDSLAWFMEHEKGVPLQMMLQHYGTLDATFYPRVDVEPLVFVELRTLYGLGWQVRDRFNSIPAQYSNRFSNRVRQLESSVTAYASVLAIDSAKRQELTREASTLLADLTNVLERQDFYVQVRQRIGTEPAEGTWIESEEGKQHNWLYGFNAYPLSSAVEIQTHSQNYSDTAHLGWRERTIAFGPDDKYLIVGWQVIDNWADGTGGRWKKAISQILLKNQGAVHVKSLHWRGLNWTVNYYFVNAGDYQFGNLQQESATAAPSPDGDLPYVALSVAGNPLSGVRVLEPGTGQVLLSAETAEHRSLQAGEQVRVAAALPEDRSVEIGRSYTLAFATESGERTLESMELVEWWAAAGVLLFARSPLAA